MKDYLNWSVEKLRRKANQAWELAGLARQDHDTTDEARWTQLAKLYDERIKELRT